MSNEHSPSQQTYEQPPEWASELLQRLTILESKVSSSDLRSDPNVTVRKPGADFTPPEELLQLFPFLNNDFFRTPLSDSDRRTFLFDCPKNTLREYDPPKSLRVNQSIHAKVLDNHLYNIQYRLSGITRPLDWYTYRFHYHQWTEDQFREHTMDLVESMHSLLSDLASHVTQTYSFAPISTNATFRSRSPARTSPQINSTSPIQQFSTTPISISTSSTNSTSSASISSSSTSSLPKIPQKRTMDNASLENSTTKKRKVYKLSSTATSLIKQKTSRGYSLCQKRFQKWCADQDVTYTHKPEIHLINYLADLHEKNYKLSSIEVYCSSLLRLFDTSIQQHIRSSHNYVNFFKNIRSNTVVSQKQWEYDITPALNYILQLGKNETLSISILTTKTIWLLSMAGFLRPSDVERIDIDKSYINTENILHLIIVAPKERRSGLRITKNISIHPHPSKSLCPVAAYQEYIKRLNNLKCITDHPTIKTIKINRCFRHVLHLNKPLQAERISKYIQLVMKKVKKPTGAPIPKARALASTLAAKAGVPIDDIVAHGSWSSRDIFEQFYRISTQGTNMTEETLNQQLISRTAKCNMM